jgi:GDP-L-fucose synthase
MKNNPADFLELRSKRICVTGSGGFLGKFVVDALRKRGCEDLVLPRKRDYDLTTAEAIERLFEEHRPQVLLHLAAVVGGIGANEHNPGLFFYENAIMGIQLLEYARRYEIEKTLVVGTICAYPKFAQIPFREETIWDGYPEETNAPYGIAKKALLVQSQAYRQQYGMNSIYILPVNLYGPHDNFDLETSHVIPALVRKALAAKERGDDQMVCWGDGSPTREFLYAEDCAEGLLLATERYNGSEPVNLGSGFEISIKELVETVNELVGYEGKVVWDTSRPNGQPRRKLDTQRAEEYFGFKSQTNLREGIRRTIEWYRAQESLVPA